MIYSYSYIELVVLFYSKKEIISEVGTDIRIINFLPAWLIILEKLAHIEKKNLLNPKISNFQFGFRESSYCNVENNISIAQQC